RARRPDVRRPDVPMADPIRGESMPPRTKAASAAGRKIVAALAAGAVVAAGVTALTSTAASAAAGCRADYTVTNQWPGGFGGSVTVTNLGDPLSSWNLRWT